MGATRRNYLSFTSQKLSGLKKHVTSGVRACVHFMKGNCTRGLECKYFHPATEDEVSAWRQIFQRHSCKHGGKCTTIGCLYGHPGQESGDPPPGGLPSTGVQTANEQWASQVEDLMLEAEQQAHMEVFQSLDAPASSDGTHSAAAVMDVIDAGAIS